VSEQASQYAYQIGMSAVGLAGLMLCYAFYRAKLVPRSGGVWGLVGYGSFFAGWHRQSWGQVWAWLPRFRGLWEIFIGVWLIARDSNKRALDMKAIIYTKWAI